jgi:pilus assembly protein Flp/PilA
VLVPDSHIHPEDYFRTLAARTWFGESGAWLVTIPGVGITYLFFKEDIMKNQLFAGIQRFIRDEEGATAVEYGLMAALIAVIIAVAVGSVGTQLKTVFEDVAKTLGKKN